MPWERKPAVDAPDTAQRSVTDDRGRRWTGVVSSGRRGGGEEYAEVVFACEGQPSEAKRVSRLNEPPAQASESWRAMGDGDLRELFDRSAPA